VLPVATQTESIGGLAGASGHEQRSLWPFYLLFFVSGFPALLYQIVWQRALFTIYGVNIESVTIIVTVFMLGLGLGSLAGGSLSKRANIPLLAVFAAIELGIAVFGTFSLPIFHAVASFTAGASALGTGLVAFAVLLLPTMLMGSTLPLLVAHLVRRNRNVGESVGALYCVNAFGSALACFAAAYFLMRVFGESGCVRIAAAINACAAGVAFLLYYTFKQPVIDAYPKSNYSNKSRQVIPFFAGAVISGVIGFVALGYEMIWYRMYSFASGRSAASFALLLGWYLAGLAYGSLAIRDLCRGRLSDDLPALLRTGGMIVTFASAAAFAVGPVVSVAVSRAPLGLTYPFVFISAALLGAAFPLASHASIDPADSKAGARLSYLYLSNIIGCASGSYLVGYFAMNSLSTEGVSIVLLSLGLAAGAGLLLAASVPSCKFVEELGMWGGRPRPRRTPWSGCAKRTEQPGGPPYIADFCSEILTQDTSRPLLSVKWCMGLAAAAIVISASWPFYSKLYERLLFKDKFAPASSFQHLVENRDGVIAVTSDNVVFGGGVYDGRISADLVNDNNGIFRAFAVDALHANPRDLLIIGLSAGAWAQVIANNPRVRRITVVEINPGYLQIIRQHSEVASLLRNPKVDIVVDDGRRWLVRNPDKKFDFVLMNTSQHWLAHTSNLLSVEFLQLIRPHLKPGGIHYYNTTFSSEALLTGATVFPYALRVGNFLAVSDSPIVFDKDRWNAALTSYSIEGQPVFDLSKPAHRIALERVLGLADTMHDSRVEQGMHLESRDSILARQNGAALVTDDNMGAEWR
jgi:spermidine synthase